MALTQGARRKIQTFVQSAKALLIREFASQLQQYYGIRPDGSYVMVEELTTHDAAIMQTARLLRERLNYLEGTIAGEDKAEEAVEQLVREQAFTILNRFAALRMAEERKIIPEAIRNGYQSEGFQVFDQLTGGAKTAEVFERYTWFLKANFDELAIDLPAVFDRFSPYALLFPSEKVLLELLKIIDDDDLSIYREEGLQPMNLWAEDETIGWVYQYYNSRDEISAMRDASSAPRNSRELAVRNQFFTPRYVVQFLVDNSLGRQWFEMTHGQTKLVDSCQYMVKRENEIFLAKGETIPEAKIEGANYIEYRALKDPRAILMLDPACGSMHFGLYCFDLFEQIYIEAWDNHPELMSDLRDKYLREDFLKQIPRLILEYNIHGVDIDPRAIQIAGLSLWLRAQKSYNELGLLPTDRPNITKSNLVVAEPMPGDVNILSDFTRSLPGPIGKLVRVIWEKMQLVGETGMLLKIEEELKKEIEIAKEEYKKYKNTSAQTTIFDAPKDSKAAEMAAIYGKDQKITKDFFDTAEEEVLKALKNFAENAQGENAFQKLLFAEDTARGFAFIELCRKRYDVIVMNPPFGAGAITTEEYYKANYFSWGKNILCCFFTRMKELSRINGNTASIFDRTVIIKSSYEPFRLENLIGRIKYVADTGWGVLDANVETTSFVLENKLNTKGIFLDLRSDKAKSLILSKKIKNKNFIEINNSHFEKLPNSVIGYDWKEEVLDLFSYNKNLTQRGFTARQGHAYVSFIHFRFFWEVPYKENYIKLYNGGSFSMFYKTPRELVKGGKNYKYVRYNKSVVLRNPDYHGKPGVGFGKRGDIFDAHLLSTGYSFTVEGQAITDLGEKNSLKVLSFLNSSASQFLLNLFTGQHKYAGYVNLLPFKDVNFDDSTVKRIIELKIKWSRFDETSLDYIPLNNLLAFDNLKFSMSKIVNELILDTAEYQKLVAENDLFWQEITKLNPQDLKAIEDQRPVENLSSFINIEDPYSGLAMEIVQFLFGAVLGRWPKAHLSNVPEISYNFNDSSLESDLSLKFNGKVSSVSYVEQDLKITPRFEQDFISKLIMLIDSTGIEEIVEFTENNNLSEIFENVNHFFEYHLKRYSAGRRVAPIYWPIATKSNSFIVWIYYPALNENTLFSILNEIVEPKLADVEKQITALEMTGDTKDFHEQLALRDELIDFKEELLRVAQLPYKPNQDDGVLITAAPLHNLFHHNKWRKDTAACWKKLEKGDYDWAHLAYSIWPDRVTKKCKKDLSMAIAHGLEDICEVMPKESNKKEKKGIKEVKQGKLI